METDKQMNISVVIPTWNREALLDKLLASLVVARQKYKYGQTEVIVVDSSEGEAKARIQESCKKHDAIYVEGDNSVRKKRNLGIDLAKYELIHFVDSDVEVCEEILNVHAETFLLDDNEKVAGSFGLTEFVGHTSIWWTILNHTTYLDSFSFAKRWPYQAWTIGNNVAIKKDVLLEIGKFKEDFPYKLGGDDLEMTYRVTKNGYLIKSAPEAATYHSTETWNHPKAIHNRTIRWGTMEYFIKTLHPELFVNCIPKADVLFYFLYLLLGILGIVLETAVPLAMLGGWVFLYVIALYFYDNKDVEKKPNPFFYFIGKGIKTNYHLFYILESLGHGDFSCLYKEMSFSEGQTLFQYKQASEKLRIWLLAMAISLIITAIRVM